MASSVRQIKFVDTPAGPTSSTTLVSAFNSAVLAGSTLLVLTQNNSQEAASSSISDSVNGSWSTLVDTLVDTDVSAQTRLRLFCFQNTAAGTPTVTATFSATTSFRGMILIEVDGVQTSSLDQHTGQIQGAPGTSANAVTSTNTSTLTSQPNIVIGISMNSSGSAGPPNAGTGYTSQGAGIAWDLGFNTIRVESKNTSATTAVAATFTALANDRHSTFVVVLLDSAAAGAMAAAVTASGSVTAGITGAGAAAATPTAAATVTTAIKGAGAVASAIACTATVVAALAGVGRPAAAITASATVTGDTVAVGRMSASILTTSTVAASAPGQAPIIANITAAGSVTAGVTGAGAIASTVSGTGTVTADLTVLTSGAMVAALSATGTASGTLLGAGVLAATPTALATLSANLTTAGAMIAALSASGSVTGVLGRLVSGDIADSVIITESVAGGVATTAAGTAAITASGTVTVAARGAGAASAALTAAATVSGTLAGAGAIAAVVDGDAVVAGTLIGAKPIAATITGSATVTASLTSGFSSVPILIGVSPMVTDTTGTSLTPDISGVAVQVNDIVIAHVCVNYDDIVTVSMPTGQGWTLINDFVSGGGNNANRHVVYWKRWGSGNTDDTTPTITLGTGVLNAWACALSAWRGCKRSGNPYEDFASDFDTDNDNGIAIAPTATSLGTARVSLRMYSVVGTSTGLFSPSEGVSAYSGDSYHTSNGFEIAIAAEYLAGEPAGAVGTATIASTVIGGANSTVADTLILIPQDQLATSITTAESLVADLRGVVPFTSNITGFAAPAASLLGAGAASASLTATADITATLGTTAAISATADGTATVSATLIGAAAASSTGIPGTATVTGTMQGLSQGEAIANITTTSTVTGTLAGAAAASGTSTGAATVSGTAIGAGAVAAAVSATGTATGTLAGDGALAAAVSTTSTVTAAAINANAGLIAANIDGTATATGTLAAAGALAGAIATTTGVTGTLINISREPGPTSILEQFRDLVGQITASPTPRFHEAGYRRRIEVEPEGGSDHAFTVEAEPMFPGRAAFGAGFVIRRMTVKVRISYVRTGGRRGNRQVINQQATEDGIRIADVCSNPDNYASQSTGIRTVDWEGTRRETDTGTREVWETRFAVEWSAEFNGSVLS